MQEYLLFTLAGPMQAWGTVAVGVIRPVSSRPTRSGLLGLLSAALGIRRGQADALQALNTACRTSVRVDMPGSRMVDFHTVQAPPGTGKRVFRTRRDELQTMLAVAEPSNPIVSRREYLANARFTACVWLEGDAGFTLADMCEALMEPALVLYLGRKSCPPGSPLLPRVVQAKDVGEALADYGLPEIYGNEDSLLGAMDVWAEPGHCIDGNFDSHTAYDMVADHGRRLFSTRQEERIVLSKGSEE